MIVAFTPSGWDDYHYWQQQDSKTIERINNLIRDWWSRRIDEKNRLVYRLVGDTIQIARCRSHYDKL